MDLIYLFLILLSIVNQLPPKQSLGHIPLVNHETSYCSIHILPRDFSNSQLYKHLQKTNNNSTSQGTPSETNELDGGPKVQEELTKTAIEEAKTWLPVLQYIPTCNKEGKCAVILLKFTAEQLKKDNEKAFDYLYHKELGQSKAVSHVEEAINSNGEKLIIATIDEETVLKGFYTHLAENKKNYLSVICGLGVVFGLSMTFFGKKVLNLLLFVAGFSVTALVVNFWEYPGRLNANSIGEPDFYWNLALVLGSGLSAAFLAVKAQKVCLCLVLGMIGVGAGTYFWYNLLNENETFVLVMFSVIVSGVLFLLGEFLLKNYKEVTAIVTSLLGATCVGASIFSFFSMNITERGFEIEELGTRKTTLVFWVSFFLLIYGVKFQLGLKKRARGTKNKSQVAAEGTKVAAESNKVVAGSSKVAAAGNDQKAQKVLKSAKLNPGKKKNR